MDSDVRRFCKKNRVFLTCEKFCLNKCRFPVVSINEFCKVFFLHTFVDVICDVFTVTSYLIFSTINVL